MDQAAAVLQLSAGLNAQDENDRRIWGGRRCTETPPGRWDLFAEDCSRRDNHSLDDDAKIFFALTNTAFDAGIAVWDAKRYYDCARSIKRDPLYV